MRKNASQQSLNALRLESGSAQRGLPLVLSFPRLRFVSFPSPGRQLHHTWSSPPPSSMLSKWGGTQQRTSKALRSTSSLAGAPPVKWLSKILRCT